MLKYIIVGVDTGKTAGIACLDLNGQIVKLATGKSVGISWFVETIKQIGSPVVIASDKKSATSSVERLAAIFDSVLFLPSSDIQVIKKKNLTSDKFRNLHERDALAAAMVAYNTYSGKLRQAERIANEKNVEAERIKAMVIRKYSVHEAIEGKKTGRRLVRGMRG